MPKGRERVSATKLMNFKVDLCAVTSRKWNALPHIGQWLAHIRPILAGLSAKVFSGSGVMVRSAGKSDFASHCVNGLLRAKTQARCMVAMFSVLSLVKRERVEECGIGLLAVEARNIMTADSSCIADRTLHKIFPNPEVPFEDRRSVACQILQRHCHLRAMKPIALCTLGQVEGISRDPTVQTRISLLSILSSCNTHDSLSTSVG